MEVLEKDKYYHIFNRGNNRENIFRNDDNREYFLKLYHNHLSNSVTTFAYCLLSNHFHLAIRVEEENKEVTQSFSNFSMLMLKHITKPTIEQKVYLKKTSDE